MRIGSAPRREVHGSGRSVSPSTSVFSLSRKGTGVTSMTRNLQSFRLAVRCIVAAVLAAFTLTTPPAFAARGAEIGASPLYVYIANLSASGMEQRVWTVGDDAVAQPPQDNVVASNELTVGPGCTQNAGCTLGSCTATSCTSVPECTAQPGCTDAPSCTQGTACTQGNGCTQGGACTQGPGCTIGQWCTLGANCTSGPFACTAGQNCTQGVCTNCTNCTSGAELHVRKQRLHAGQLVHAGTVLHVWSGVLHVGQPVHNRPGGVHVRPGLHRRHAVHRRSGWLHDGPELHER